MKGRKDALYFLSEFSVVFLRNVQHMPNISGSCQTCMSRTHDENETIQVVVRAFFVYYFGLLLQHIKSWCFCL